MRDHRSSIRSSTTSSSRIPDKNNNGDVVVLDQWLLLEHCCYGLAFGPLLLLTFFVCRIFLLSLSSLWKRTHYKGKCEESSSLWHALAHKWHIVIENLLDKRLQFEKEEQYLLSLAVRTKNMALLK